MLVQEKTKFQNSHNIKKLTFTRTITFCHKREYFLIKFVEFRKKNTQKIDFYEDDNFLWTPMQGSFSIRSIVETKF